MNKLGVLEGLLFAVGDDGLSLNSIAEIMDIDISQAKKLLKELKDRYSKEEYGIRISYMGETFKLTTKKEHKDYFKKLLGDASVQTLSESNLEVLAIIAYNQPITRAVIDDMRGVSSGQIVRKLAARGLVHVVGKSKMPGRPNLYGTTKEFLDYFGLASIEDLPEIKEEVVENSESDLFTSIYKENI